MATMAEAFVKAGLIPVETLARVREEKKQAMERYQNVLDLLRELRSQPTPLSMIAIAEKEIKDLKEKWGFRSDEENPGYRID